MMRTTTGAPSPDTGHYTTTAEYARAGSGLDGETKPKKKRKLRETTEKGSDKCWHDGDIGCGGGRLARRIGLRVVGEVAVSW